MTTRLSHSARVISTHVTRAPPVRPEYIHSNN
jgi:hypothetical protein